MTDHTIGVDISKSHLDVFHLDEQRAQRFDSKHPPKAVVRRP
jgi:transposase